MSQKLIPLISKLNNSEIITLLKNNGYGEFEEILMRTEVNGYDLLTITEFEISQWNIPRPSKRRLWSCLTNLRDNPQVFLNQSSEKEIPDTTFKRRESLKLERSHIKLKLEQVFENKNRNNAARGFNQTPTQEMESEEYSEIEEAKMFEEHYDESGYLRPLQSAKVVEENEYEPFPEDQAGSYGPNQIRAAESLAQRKPMILPRDLSRRETGVQSQPPKKLSAEKLVPSSTRKPLHISKEASYINTETEETESEYEVPPDLPTRNSVIRDLTPVPIRGGPRIYENVEMETQLRSSPQNTFTRRLKELFKLDTKPQTLTNIGQTEDKDEHNRRNDESNVSTMNTPKFRPLPKFPATNFGGAGQNISNLQDDNTSQSSAEFDYENTPASSQRDNVTQINKRYNFKEEPNKNLDKPKGSLPNVTITGRHIKNRPLPKRPEEEFGQSLPNLNLLDLSTTSEELTYGNTPEGFQRDNRELQVSKVKYEHNIPEPEDNLFYSNLPDSKNVPNFKESNHKKYLPHPPIELPPIELQPIELEPEDYDQCVFNLNDEPFYRNTDRKGAKKLLHLLQDGAFLFRPSKRFFLTLTIKYKARFFNLGIDKTQNNTIRCHTDDGSMSPEFATIQDFVTHFSREVLTFNHNNTITEVVLKKVLPSDLF